MWSPIRRQAIIPQRIIYHAEVSDSEVAHLVALAARSTINSAPPTINAWGSPPTSTAATTQLTTTYSTLSASQTTMMSELAAKVKSLENKLESQDTSIVHHQNNNSSVLPENISDLISAQVSDSTATFRSDFAYLKRKSLQHHEDISVFYTKIDAQDSAIATINERIDEFETNISTQVAPLNEAIQAGGLAALIQKTVLGCLNQTQHHRPIPPQPMDEDLSHTPPRQLFDHARSDQSSTGSAKKRGEPPSPFSRNGQPSPLRVRRDHQNSASPRKTKNM
jgi:hypothetical protein